MSRRTPPKVLAASIAGLFALSMPLADAAEDLATIVVTATRQPQRVSELLADVTLITREDIEQAGQSSVSDLLARQPGLQITSNGGPGKASSIYIRGATDKQTLVLIDGVRIGSATLGSPSLSQIPLAQIERIEILRGPGSALYGADAVGGVIQIFTKKGKGPLQPDIFVGIGSRNTKEASAGFSGGDERWSYALRGGYSDTDGINAIADRGKQRFSYDPSRDKDGFRNASVSGSVAFRPADGHEIGASLLMTDGRNWYDSGPDFDTRADVAQSVFSLYTRNRWTEGWTSTLRASRSIDDSTDFSPNVPEGARFKTTQDQLAWQNDVRLPVGNLLVALETLNQKALSEGNFDRSRRIDSVLAGWSGNIGNHRLQANVRHDDNSQFGSKTTGYGGYGYQITPALRAQVSLGSAFRAPTFNELYYPDFGNPDLKPESAFNKEIGLVWELGAQRASATIFDNRVKDLIVTVCDASFDCAPENVSKAKLRGLTLAYGDQIAGFNIDASADFLDARDADTDQRLPRRASRQASLRVSRPIGPWTVGGEWLVVGHRYDSSTETRRMGGYGLVNTFARYAVNKDWSVEGRVNNLGNKKYETAWGYGSVGTDVFVGVRYAPTN